MRLDPSAVPHPRASYEQIPDQRIPKRQPLAQWPTYQPTPYQSARYEPERYEPERYEQGQYRQAPDDQTPFQPASDGWPYERGRYQQVPDEQPAPAHPARSFGAWPGEPHSHPAGPHPAGPQHAGPESADPRAEAMLAQVRLSGRRARRMQFVCVLLGVGTAVIFLAAAASHQLDGRVELLTPVLLLISAVNSRRYAQRAAQYRAAEADILARGNG